MKKYGLQAVLGIFLLSISFVLLKKDAAAFLSWWGMSLILGCFAMPLTECLFEGFSDRGWMFSKVLAIGITGYLNWVLVTLGVIPFQGTNSIAVCLIFGVACSILLVLRRKQEQTPLSDSQLSVAAWEEVLFLAVFLFWTYLAGFHPEAYGTEKFMDYGFMSSMMRSTTLPPRDFWYSQGTLNYYYGGQYFAVFLTQITFTRVEQSYNLMRAFVAAFTFVLPFSLVFQMVRDRLWEQGRTHRTSIQAIAGLTAGAAVCMAGNMHYVIYALIRPAIQQLSGAEPDSIDSYWFPDATRYIGYNPPTEDKTIHEFPSYSFVLGDLHAHVVNLMFVLLIVGLLYAWLRLVLRGENDREYQIIRVQAPHILVAGWLLGMFQWTNYWDFVIYFVVTGAVVCFGNVILLRGEWAKVLLFTVLEALGVYGLAFLCSLPFTMRFQSMVDSVAFARNHSLPHQLAVLWGLPVVLTSTFLVVWLAEKRWQKGHRGLYELFAASTVPDLFAVLAGLCAMGLVLIPELVYVRDIYESGSARANTMFKLTYQAYLLFGITMAYVIYRMLMMEGRAAAKVLAAAGLFCLVMTMGYLGECVNSWYGDIWKPASYRGLDATSYLERDFPEDAGAIRWLNQNVQGCPVTLEANGDSYTGYERVSSATGLPTVLGWYVHEWLWRSDPADLNEKSSDIQTIYTSREEETVRDLLRKYEISYIFIGSREKEKYQEELNTSLLIKLGTVVYQDPEWDTCIVSVM